MTNFECMAKHKLCYLATPYSKYPRGIHIAHVEACRFAAGLMREGINVYCPIAHGHPISMAGGIDPRDYMFWKKQNASLLDMTDALIVAEMPGWTESRGVQHEIAVFDVAKKPIYYLAGDCFL